MDQLKKNLALGFFVVIVPLGLLWAWWPEEKEALPADNGFEDFLAAGRMIASGPGLPRSSTGPGSSFLSDPTNAEAMKLVRRGLTKTTRLPLSAMAQNPAMANEYLRGTQLISLGMRREELDQWTQRGNTNETRRLLLELLRFGHEAYRGGLLGHMQQGAGIEAMVADRLQTIFPAPDAAACRELVQALAAVDEKAERPAAMWQRDVLFKGQTNIWQVVIPDAIYHAARTDLKASKEQFLKLTYGAARLRKHTLVDYAARLHELETGKRPASFADLVPKYLKTVPKDPETGKELSYAF